MKLKVDDSGNAVLENGNPVYIDDDGKDLVMDVPGLYSKVRTLNGESAARRQKIEELTARYAPVKDIEDLSSFLTKANEAFETLKAYEGKDSEHTAKIDELKASIKQSYEGKINDLKKGFETQLLERQDVISGKDAMIYDLMVSSQFSSSPWFSGEAPKTVLLPEIAESYFGKNFKVEEHGGKLRVIGYLDGNMIYSRQNPGEPADFNEAVEEIISKYPMKDRILRAGKQGSGSQGNHDGGNPGDKLSKLRKQHAAAVKSGNMALAIAIKNQIHQAERER